MTENDTDPLEKRLAALSGRKDAVEAPPFDAVFAAAGRRLSMRRRARYAAGAAAAAALVAAAVLMTGQPAANGGYIDTAELMATTSWRAPSDVLLPRRRIDLYENLPSISGSTGPAEGALL